MVEINKIMFNKSQKVAHKHHQVRLLSETF